jgi:hypothetical protein
MFKGKSWTHTAFMHNEAWKRQATTSFCNDVVVCQYWKLEMIQKVGPQFPEYLLLTNKMKEILPIMEFLP